MVTVRPLTERDLPEAQRIIRDAFGTFLGVPDLETFRFPPYAHTRFGAENVVSFAAERDGELLGSNFATNWGSVGFFGPLSTRPDLWDAGIGQLLVTAACDAFEGWGIRHAGLFTFAQSAKHVGLYGKFGFHPRFLTAIMAQPARPPGNTGWSRYSELPRGQRAEVEDATRELSDEALCRARFARRDQNSRGPQSRRHGAAVGRRQPPRRLCDLPSGVRRAKPATASALSNSAPCVPAPAARTASPRCSMPAPGSRRGRHDHHRRRRQHGARRGLPRRCWRAASAPQIQGVTMHRPNEPGYSRPGLFVLDDWR